MVARAPRFVVELDDGGQVDVSKGTSPLMTRRDVGILRAPWRCEPTAVREEFPRCVAPEDDELRQRCRNRCEMGWLEATVTTMSSSRAFSARVTMCSILGPRGWKHNGIHRLGCVADPDAGVPRRNDDCTSGGGVGFPGGPLVRPGRGDRDVGDAAYSDRAGRARRTAPGRGNRVAASAAECRQKTTERQA